MAQRWFMMALAAVAAVAATTEAATKHVVGGSTGWTIPSSSSLYPQWASSQTFAVGDTLVFNFTTGIHNVVEVPKSSYDSCTPSKQIGSTLTAGPATVTLTKPGSHYYICGVAGHCSIGQKLAVTVAPATSSSSPAPAPAPSAPPSPAPAPSAVSPATTPAASPAAPATSPSSPAPAPSAVSPATAPAASPAAATPAGPPAPSSRGGPTAGPTADNQNPTAVAGPAGGGPGTSSATSLSLSAGIAAVLSAAAAFLL